MVPEDFIFSRVRLPWREVRAGIEAGYCPPGVATVLASGALERGELDDDLLDLAFRKPSDRVLDVVVILAERDVPQDSREISRLWAYLLLDWVLSSEVSREDPLDLAERLYSDLDYPPRMAPFVRYMPSEASAGRTVADCEEFMRQKLRAFVEEERRRFQARAER